ncbi:hypothetical protein PS662_03564 [Pseudomonas fluorescens]|uniref:DUF4062 domain-containing protein n=1 Tax=Pseudomonas fluorescens TaxID=294 RepID=A0A5E6UHM1_PSEFL|nr:tetratricopeptide repeat protein [Pseudomonas fluorescens]VVN05285.1 hypothetical protein PS662_03564 [Pseudomonas fluorescens]
MTQARIFISAVSTELRSARQIVARVLRRQDCIPVFQEDFPTPHGELSKWLIEQIDACEGFIQLVGRAYGDEPKVRDPEFGRVSFTQLEYYHAIRRGKTSWVIVVGEQCCDIPAERLDLPDENHLDPVGYQTERQMLQRAYLQNLVDLGKFCPPAHNQDQLQNLVHNMREELDKLRPAAPRSSGVDIEKIRIHLLQAVKATRQRELAEAEKADDWRDRERQRQVAENSYTAQSNRIEELAASFAEIEGKDSATGVLQEMTRILQEDGVDDAIAYMATKRSGILTTIRNRSVHAHERNRKELEPLLRAAALNDTKGQVQEARRLYADVLVEEPDWPEALDAAFRFLVEQGDLAQVRSTLVEALQNYEDAHRHALHLATQAADNAQWQIHLAMSYDRVGSALEFQGDGPGALVAYRQALAIDRALVDRDPDNIAWQRNLSVSHERVGDLLESQGDGAGAYAAYDSAHAIRKMLTTHDPVNPDWQRDLSISFGKLGNVHKARGDGPAALHAYGEALAIREQLIRHDPGNLAWQRDLSVSHERIGDVLLAQGNGSGARIAFRKAHRIRSKLVKRDRKNTEWQRDLSITYGKIGDVRKARGDGRGAFKVYRKSFSIRRKLTRHDPSNAKWQRDLALSHDRIGSVLRDRDDVPGAFDAFRTSFSIRHALTQRNPQNTDWQGDLAISHELIGDMLKRERDLDGALDNYQTSFNIHRALTLRDGENSHWQRGLAASHRKVGDIWKKQGDKAKALADYKRALAINQTLNERDSVNAVWQRDLSITHRRIGDVLKALGDSCGAITELRISLSICEALIERDPHNVQWQRDYLVVCSKLKDCE